MWVAEQEGLFKQYLGDGMTAEIDVFDSAQNLSAAITAGEVDLAMTDPMRTIKLCESGTELSMVWITLGTTAKQGRFGVLVSKDTYSELSEKNLAGLAQFVDTASFTDEDSSKIGVASNTVPEYVFDKLCDEEGLSDNRLGTVEVASLPERYQMVASGKILGAALPASLLALGEAEGMKVLADDTKGSNVSQSVMVVRKEYLDANSGVVDGLAQAWNAAAKLINKTPENYRDLLVEKANLNDKVAKTYPISSYPRATASNGAFAYPPAKLIKPQITWMNKKGYSEKNVTYNESDGSFTIE